MATCMLVVHVQRCLLIPNPGLPEQPEVWNFLNFECLTLQEVVRYSYLGYCPKTSFPYSHYPKYIFSQTVGVWAQDLEWRLSESCL